MFAPFLDGKVALVTGGVGSIGQAIVVELAKAGCSTVVITGRQGQCPPDTLRHIKEAAQITTSQKDPLVYMQADLRSCASMEGLVADVIAQHRKLDILVNCAGVQHVAPVDELSVGDWDEIIAVNLTAVFHMTRLVLPHMKAQGWGRLVNIASVLGLVGNKDKGAYTASKHGVVGLTKAVALETATTNITCNAVCPGYVDTPLLRKEIMALADEQFGGDFDKAVHQVMIEKQPSLNFVSCEAVGQSVVFLCSPAAKEMRGTTITPDGATATG